MSDRAGVGLASVPSAAASATPEACPGHEQVLRLDVQHFAPDGDLVSFVADAAAMIALHRR